MGHFHFESGRPLFNIGTGSTERRHWELFPSWWPESQVYSCHDKLTKSIKFLSVSLWFDTALNFHPVWFHGLWYILSHKTCEPFFIIFAHFSYNEKSPWWMYDCIIPENYIGTSLFFFYSHKLADFHNQDPCTPLKHIHGFRKNRAQIPPPLHLCTKGNLQAHDIGRVLYADSGISPSRCFFSFIPKPDGYPCTSNFWVSVDEIMILDDQNPHAQSIIWSWNIPTLSNRMSCDTYKIC